MTTRHEDLPAYPHHEKYDAPLEKKELSPKSKFSLGLPSTWSLDPSKRGTAKRDPSRPNSTWDIDPATRTSRAPQAADGSVDPLFGGPRHAVASRGEVDPITGTSRTWTTTDSDRRAPIRSAWSINPSNAAPKRDAFGGHREPQYTSSTTKPQRGGAFRRVDSTWSVDPNAVPRSPPAYTAPPAYVESPEHKKRGLKSILTRA